MQSDMDLIGNRLKNLRYKYLKVNQKTYLSELNEFAEKKNIIVNGKILSYTQSDISFMENNRNKVGKEKYFTLFMFLIEEKNVNINYLFDKNLAVDAIINKELLL